MKTADELRKDRAIKILRGDPHIVDPLDQKIFVGDFVAHTSGGDAPTFRVGIVEEIMQYGGGFNFASKVRLLFAERRQTYVYRLGASPEKKKWHRLSRPSLIHSYDRLLRIEPEEIEGVYTMLLDWYDERAAKKAK